MRVIAIEEHFITPMYREKVGANEYRNFYLTSRGEMMGHDIMEQNLDIGAKRIALTGRTPSETVYCPASSLETICAARPRGAGASSAAATIRIATFGSFMSSRALVRAAYPSGAGLGGARPGVSRIRFCNAAPGFNP